MSFKYVSNIPRLTLTRRVMGDASKSTRLANPPLSAVKRRPRRLCDVEGSRQKETIFEGRTSGFPFLLLALKRRFASVSRDAVVWKKCSGSLETLMIVDLSVDLSRV